jgi:hypothetical protein
MKCIYRLAYILSIACFSNSVVIAQATPEMPVIRPIPFGATLPQDGVWDLVGVKLGSNIQETISQIKSVGAAGEPNLYKGSTGIGDGRGNSVSFSYDGNLFHEIRNTDGSQENWHVSFTTNVSESRNYLISRQINYHQASRQGSIPELLSGLSKKYGEPSVVHVDGRRTEVVYVWFRGARATFNPNQFARMRFTSGTPEFCAYSIAGTGDKYNFINRRQETAPGCDAVFRVVIEHGLRDDLINSVEFRMFDRKRAHESAVVVDKFLLEELDKKIRGQAGSGPRL